MKYIKLFEEVADDDRSFNRDGYFVSIKRNKRFGGDAWMLSIYKGHKEDRESYAMGLRGPCSYEQAMDAAKIYIDGVASKMTKKTD